MIDSGALLLATIQLLSAESLREPSTARPAVMAIYNSLTDSISLLGLSRYAAEFFLFSSFLSRHTGQWSVV